MSLYDLATEAQGLPEAWHSLAIAGVINREQALGLREEFHTRKEQTLSSVLIPNQTLPNG